MSFEITSKFIEEFNYLDDILKDMYPNAVQSKLGVTRYLENMKSKETLGLYKVQNWDKDYKRLKLLRNNRNDAIHKNMLNANLFNNEDIDWIIAFKNRILSRKDPLSLLKNISIISKSSIQKKANYEANQYKPNNEETYQYRRNNKKASRFIIAVLLICISILILYIINK